MQAKPMKLPDVTWLGNYAPIAHTVWQFFCKRSMKDVLAFIPEAQFLTF